jgi:GT2 family glycosyltransferase
VTVPTQPRLELLAPVAVRTVNLDAPSDLALARVGRPFRSALLVGLREGRPIGAVATGEVNDQRLSGDEIARLFEGIESPPQTQRAQSAALPRLSVVVTTCAQAESTAAAVESVLACDPPALEVIVVENRPVGSPVPALLRELFGENSRVRYVEESHRGLSAARNAGLREARGDAVAFTDDDVIVAREWVGWLASSFGEEADVGCVTGLIVPGDLTTEAQVVMEQFAGFGKGYQRRVHRITEPTSPIFPFGAGEFGSGACTALRRDVGLAIGGFDTALGAGTVSRGGEDLDLFVRLLLAGHAIVYEPAAMISHRHPDNDEHLRTEVFSYGMGLAAMLTKQALDGQAVAIARRIPAALRHLLAADSRKNVRKGPSYPRRLDWIERAGMLAGPSAYLRSRRHERRLAARRAS